MTVIPFPRIITAPVPAPIQHSPRADPDDGPSAAELSALVAQEPLISAEIDLVDAEIRVLCAEPHPTELDWRRLRRAERRVAREVVALSAGVDVSSLAA